LEIDNIHARRKQMTQPITQIVSSYCQQLRFDEETAFLISQDLEALAADVISCNHMQVAAGCASPILYRFGGDSLLLCSILFHPGGNLRVACEAVRSSLGSAPETPARLFASASGNLRLALETAMRRGYWLPTRDLEKLNAYKGSFTRVTVFRGGFTKGAGAFPPLYLAGISMTFVDVALPLCAGGDLASVATDAVEALDAPGVPLPGAEAIYPALERAFNTVPEVLR
jgi:hypothetical protein